jgi:ceramide glucosyltransferase
VLVTHASTEQSLAALVRHELRWMATVRAVNPGGHVGALLLHALPMALIAVALSPGWASSVVAGVAIAARLSCVRAVDRLVGRPTLSVFLLPFRDVLTFAMHLASLFIHRVEWRGARLAMRGAGLIEAERA